MLDKKLSEVIRDIKGIRVNNGAVSSHIHIQTTENMERGEISVVSNYNGERPAHIVMSELYEYARKTQGQEHLLEMLDALRTPAVGGLQ